MPCGDFLDWKLPLTYASNPEKVDLIPSKALVYFRHTYKFRGIFRRK